MNTKLNPGGIYLIAFKEGSVTASDSERCKKELLELGVHTVWVALSNRMTSAQDQIEITKLV